MTASAAWVNRPHRGLGFIGMDSNRNSPWEVTGCQEGACKKPEGGTGLSIQSCGADPPSHAQQGCSRVCTGPSASTLGQKVKRLSPDLQLGQHFLSIHPSPLPHCLAVGIHSKHQPHQEHIRVILCSQVGDGCMTVRGMGLQFFHFPFAQAFSGGKKIINNRKIFKSSPALPPSPSCPLFAGEQGLPQLLKDFSCSRRAAMLNTGPAWVSKSPGFGKRAYI